MSMGPDLRRASTFSSDATCGFLLSSRQAEQHCVPAGSGSDGAPSYSHCGTRAYRGLAADAKARLRGQRRVYEVGFVKGSPYRWPRRGAAVLNRSSSKKGAITPKENDKTAS
jgi:hypothetical protein